MPVHTNPKDMKSGVHYCTLCDFKSKDKSKVRDHQRKVHKR